MRLVVVTPRAVLVDREVDYVRAEDESGAFGVLERHAPLLTALTVSVLVYRDRDPDPDPSRGQRERFVAVRGGLLMVAGGGVQVLTREAVAGDDLQSLERDVLERFRRGAADEDRARAGAGKLESALLRRVTEYVHVRRRHAGQRP